MAFETLTMDAGRICDGLSRIGYTPPAAITDIMDNAVTAGSTHIVVKIVRVNEARGDNRRDNVREYLIMDDGAGMDEGGIKNALTLGATDMHYGPGSLSKFGLGLKSASFSQGETLEVLSSPGGGAPFIKYRVSLKEIRARGEYGAEQLGLTETDNSLIAEYLPDGHGTIVRIGDVRKNNHPAIKNTVDELQQRVGIIYYYFMHDDGLQIDIDGTACTPLDPLFTEEAKANGNLDENVWDGLETRWIQTPDVITLDAAGNIKANIEVTQLPHPPSFKYESDGKQAETRDKYRIEAGNYGYYVYRNKRLLSWAERFSGTGRPIIPQNNDYFSFRGRILLTDAADDYVNLDVKKSQIMLSEEAYKALSDASANYRRKSANAWQHRSAENKRRDDEDSIGTVNRLANEASTPEDLPGTPETDAAIVEQKRRAAEIQAEQEKRFAALAIATEGSSNPESMQAVVEGEDAKTTDRVFRVTQVTDHALYEPYYDAVKKDCVRVNRTHRFAQVVYQDNGQNGGLQILFDLMLLKMAAAEVFTVKQLQKYDSRQVQTTLSEYRRWASEFLAQMCRDIGDELPHDE